MKVYRFAGFTEYDNDPGFMDLALEISDRSLRFEAWSTTQLLENDEFIEWQTWHTKGIARWVDFNLLTTGSIYQSARVFWRKDGEQNVATMLNILVEFRQGHRFCIVDGRWNDDTYENSPNEGVYSFHIEFDGCGYNDDELWIERCNNLKAPQRIGSHIKSQLHMIRNREKTNYDKNINSFYFRTNRKIATKTRLKNNSSKFKICLISTASLLLVIILIIILLFFTIKLSIFLMKLKFS